MLNGKKAEVGSSRRGSAEEAAMSASRYMRLCWHVVTDVYGMRSAMTSIAQTRYLVHLPI